MPMQRGSSPLHGVGRIRGFTLLTVLATLALVSLAWTTAMPMWAMDAQREREADLLRVGMLYANALARYRDTLPGSVRSYPTTLDELLLDRRVPGVRRHMRALYPDPISADGVWGLVHDEFGRIVGVYSKSNLRPVRRESVVLEDRVLLAAQVYSDWKFLALSQP